MGEPGDPASAEASAVRLWRLAEECDPDNAANKKSLELDDYSSPLDLEDEGSDFSSSPTIGLRFTIRPFGVPLDCAGEAYLVKVAPYRDGCVDRDVEAVMVDRDGAEEEEEASFILEKTRSAAPTSS